MKQMNRYLEYLCSFAQGITRVLHDRSSQAIIKPPQRGFGHRFGFAKPSLSQWSLETLQPNQGCFPVDVPNRNSHSDFPVKQSAPRSLWERKDLIPKMSWCPSPGNKVFVAPGDCHLHAGLAALG